MDAVTEDSPVNSAGEDVLADIFHASDPSTSSESEFESDDDNVKAEEGGARKEVKEKEDRGYDLVFEVEGDSEEEELEEEKPLFPQLDDDHESFTKPNIRYHTDDILEIYYGDRKGTIEVLRLRNGIELDHNMSERLRFSCLEEDEDDQITAVDFFDDDSYILYGTFGGKLDLIRLSIQPQEKFYENMHIYQTPHGDPIVHTAINRIDSGFICASYYNSNDLKEELVVLDLARQQETSNYSELVKYHFLNEIDAVSWNWYNSNLLTVSADRCLRVLDLRAASQGPRTLYHEHHCKLIEPCKWRPEIFATASSTRKGKTDSICLFDIRKLAVPLMIYEVDADVAEHGIDTIHWHPHDPYELMYSSRGARFIGKVDTESCTPFSTTVVKAGDNGRYNTISIDRIWDLDILEEQVRYDLERSRNACYPISPEPIQLLDYTAQMEAAALCNSQLEMPLMVRSPRFPLDQLGIRRESGGENDELVDYYVHEEFHAVGSPKETDESTEEEYSIEEGSEEEAITECAIFIHTDTQPSTSASANAAPDDLDTEEPWEDTLLAIKRHCFEEKAKLSEENSGLFIKFKRKEDGKLQKAIHKANAERVQTLKKPNRIAPSNNNIYNFRYLRLVNNEDKYESNILNAMTAVPVINPELKLDRDENAFFDDEDDERSASTADDSPDNTVGVWCPRKILQDMDAPTEIKTEALEFLNSVLPENTVIGYESAQMLAKVVKNYLEQEYLNRSDFKRYYDDSHFENGVFGYQSEDAVLSFCYPPKHFNGVVFMSNSDFGKIQYLPPSVQPGQAFPTSYFMTTMQQVKAYDLYANIPLPVWKKYYAVLSRWQKAASTFGHEDLIGGMLGWKKLTENEDLLEDRNWLGFAMGSVKHYEGRIKSEFLKGIYKEYKNMWEEKRKKRKLQEEQAYELAEKLRIEVVSRPHVPEYNFMSPRSSQNRISAGENLYANKPKEFSIDPLSTIGASHFLSSLVDDDEKEDAIEDEAEMKLLLETPELRSIASTRSLKSVATTAGTTPHGTPQDKRNSVTFYEKRGSLNTAEGSAEESGPNARKRSRPIPIAGTEGAPRKYSANWSGGERKTYEEDPSANSFKWLFGDSMNSSRDRDLRTPSGRSPRTVAEEKAARQREKEEKKYDAYERLEKKQREELMKLRQHVSGAAESDEPLAALKPDELRFMTVGTPPEEEKTPTKQETEEECKTPTPHVEGEDIPKEIVPVWEVIKAMEKRESRRSTEELAREPSRVEEASKEPAAGEDLEEPSASTLDSKKPVEKQESSKTLEAPEDNDSEDEYCLDQEQDSILDILTTVSAVEDERDKGRRPRPRLSDDDPNGRQKKLSAVLEEDHDDLSPKPRSDLMFAPGLGNIPLQKLHKHAEIIHIAPPRISREKSENHDRPAFHNWHSIEKKAPTPDPTEPTPESESVKDQPISSSELQATQQVVEEDDLKSGYGTDLGSTEISPRDALADDEPQPTVEKFPPVEPLNLRELEDVPRSSGMTSQERLATDPENPINLVQEAAAENIVEPEKPTEDDDDSDEYMWIELNPRPKVIEYDSDGEPKQPKSCSYEDLLAYIYQVKRRRFVRVKKRKPIPWVKKEVKLRDVDRIKDEEPEETYFEYLVRQEEEKMKRAELKKKRREERAEKLKSTTTDACSSMSSIPATVRATTTVSKKHVSSTSNPFTRKRSEPIIEFVNRETAQVPIPKKKPERKPLFFYGLPANDQFHTVRIHKDDFDYQMKGFPGLLQLMQCEVEDDDEELHYLPFDTSLILHLKLYTSFYRERMLKAVRMAHEDVRRLKFHKKKEPTEGDYYELMLICLLQGHIHKFFEYSEDVHELLQFRIEKEAHEFAENFVELCKDFIEFIFNYRNHDPDNCSMHRYNFDTKIEDMIGDLDEYFGEYPAIYPILMLMRQEVMEDHQPGDFGEAIMSMKELPLYVRILFVVRACDAETLEKCLVQEFMEAKGMNRLVFTGLGNHADSFAVLADYLDETKDFQTVAHLCLAARIFEEDDHYFEVLQELLTASDPDIERPIVIEPEFQSTEMPEELFHWPNPPDLFNIYDFDNYDMDDDQHPINKLVKMWKREVPGGAARIFAWMYKNGRLPPHHSMEDMFPRRFVPATQSREVYVEICRQAIVRYFEFLNAIDSRAVYGHLLEEITLCSFPEDKMDSAAMLRHFLIRLSGNKSFRPLVYPKLKILATCQFCGMTRVQGAALKKKNEEMEKKESLKEAKLHGKPSDHIHRSRLVTDSEEFVDLQGDADDDQNGSVYPLESEVERFPEAACPNCRRPMGRCAVCHIHDRTEWNVFPKARKFERQWCICHRCHHGGHVVHLMDWFKTQTSCPIPQCDCECNRSTLFKTLKTWYEETTDFFHNPSIHF